MGGCNHRLKMSQTLFLVFPVPYHLGSYSWVPDMNPGARAASWSVGPYSQMEHLGPVMWGQSRVRWSATCVASLPRQEVAKVTKPVQLAAGVRGLMSACNLL